MSSKLLPDSTLNWLSTHNDKNVSKSSLPSARASRFQVHASQVLASWHSHAHFKTCAYATWHGNPAVDQVIVRLRGGGPNLCLYLTSHALSERQDVEQATAMGKKIRALTAEYFLGSIWCNLLGAAPDEAAALGGVARAALPQLTQDDPRVPLVSWNESCVGAIRAWRASGHPHARPSSRPLQPSRPFLPNYLR